MEFRQGSGDYCHAQHRNAWSRVDTPGICPWMSRETPSLLFSCWSFWLTTLLCAKWVNWHRGTWHLATGHFSTCLHWVSRGRSQFVWRGRLLWPLTSQKGSFKFYILISIDLSRRILQFPDTFTVICCSTALGQSSAVLWVELCGFWPGLGAVFTVEWRDTSMTKMNRPAPVEVCYKNMRFLITHNPTNATLSSFIEVRDHHMQQIILRYERS